MVLNSNWALARDTQNFTLFILVMRSIEACGMYALSKLLFRQDHAVAFLTSVQNIQKLHPSDDIAY